MGVEKSTYKIFIRKSKKKKDEINNGMNFKGMG